MIFFCTKFESVNMYKIKGYIIKNSLYCCSQEHSYPRVPLEKIGVLMKHIRTLSPSLLCPPPSFCLWKSFSQRIHFIREVKQIRKQRKTVKQDKTVTV